jgi:hypothetical protein
MEKLQLEDEKLDLQQQVQNLKLELAKRNQRLEEEESDEYVGNTNE